MGKPRIKHGKRRRIVKPRRLELPQKVVNEETGEALTTNRVINIPGGSIARVAKELQPGSLPTRNKALGRSTRGRRK